MSLLLLALVFSGVSAQLAQDTVQTNGGVYYYAFGPAGTIYTKTKVATATTPIATVVSTPVAAQPILVYNCYQMPAICNNVAKYLAAKGLSLPLTQVYDLQTGGDLPHTAKRRTGQCPDSWSNNHPCPEPDQPPTNSANFANNGPTEVYFTDPNAGLDPVTAAKQLKDYKNFIVDTSRNEKLVGLRYSCDEFPPATWISGGTGLDGSNPGTTYCAPHRAASCTQYSQPLELLWALSGLSLRDRSEQDWQGESHNKLRDTIFSLYNLPLPNVPANIDYAGTFQFSTLAAREGLVLPTTYRAWVVQPGVATKIVNKRGETTATTHVQGPAITHYITGKKVKKPKKWVQLWKVIYHTDPRGVSTNQTTEAARLMERQLPTNESIASMFDNQNLIAAREVEFDGSILLL